MVMTDITSVAANTTSANVLAGKAMEFIPEASVIVIGACGSAAGLYATVIIGSEVVVDDQPIGAQNHLPIFPDDTLAEAGAFPGDRITVRYRNSTGGALTAQTKINISPV